MDGDNNTPVPPSPPLALPAPPPQRPPETISIPPFTLHPFPTTSTNSSPSSTHHRKKRSKLTRIEPAIPTTLVAVNEASHFEPPTPTSLVAVNEASHMQPPAPTTLVISEASPSTSRKTPARKPDPSAPKITPPCTECGKRFWSSKALFGHMRCHPERQWRGINPPPHLRRSPPPPPPPLPVSRTTSDVDREVATSLLLLGSSVVTSDDRTHIAETSTRFECSSCKKTFPTHQALGGHRASHKNVKGCFAITRSGVEEEGGSSITPEGYSGNFTGNTEVGFRLGLGLGFGWAHKCWICNKVFSSGQALGGHMRCHGEKHEEASTSSVVPGAALGPATQPSLAQCGLDLNQPAQEEDDVGPPVGSTGSSSSSSMQLDLRLGI